MAVLPLLIAPDPRLALKSELVKSVGPAEKQLIADMLDTLYSSESYGALAAPQANAHKRIVVIDLHWSQKKKDPLILINPVITRRSAETEICDEGCVSVADYWAKVERALEVTVEYLDQDGQPQTLDASGLLARCIQHELDHLEGILFIDHLSSLRRSMAIKKSAKSKTLAARE